MKRTAIAIAVGALSTGLSHGLLAADTQNDDAQNQSGQQMSEDSAQNDQAGSQAEIRVEEEAADVNVDQEPADVTVEQEPPDVTVEQQPPEVTIEQQDPDVDVDQAEPDVTVEQQGEADVEVEHAEEAEAELLTDEQQQEQQQNAEEQDEQQPATQADSEDQAALGDALMSQTVSEIEGQTLFSQEDDEEIGEVERVVRDTESNELFVVIAEGGFLGFGEDEMGYSLDEIEVRAEEELQVQSSDRGESGDYGEARYEEVEDDLTLQEASQGN